MDCGLQILTASLAGVSLDLEDVGEIRGEAQLQWQVRCLTAEVREPQPLVQSRRPEEAAALDVDDALRNGELTQRRQRPVGEMGREQRVVLGNRRAEERRMPAGDLQLEARQDARVAPEQAVVAPLDVPERVREQKGIPVLQGESRQQAATLPRRHAHARLSYGSCGRRRSSRRVYTSRYPCAITVAVKRRSNAARTRHRSTLGRRAIAASASSSEFTMNPLMPCSTTSGTEPRFQAMTGVPQAIASIITRPKGSGQSMGNSSARAWARNSLLRSSPISPM